jgi:hypothetical protein
MFIFQEIKMEIEIWGKRYKIKKTNYPQISILNNIVQTIILIYTFKFFIITLSHLEFKISLIYFILVLTYNVTFSV